MSNESNLKGWLTFSKAAKKHDIDPSTLRKAVAAKRFLPDEIDLVGKTYLVKESAMDRLYPKKKSISDRMEEAKKKSASKSLQTPGNKAKSIDNKER